MANPVVTAVTAGSWVKVATNVQDVSVHPLTTNGAQYRWTYRTTGAAAPTLANEQVAFGHDGVSITSSAGIDVYVWVFGDGITTANVRVDVGLNVTYLIDG